MNANTVVDAIANKQYNAAEEAIAEMLQSKVSDALVAKKEEVSQDFGSQLGEAKHDKDYDEFFNKAMKKFGISSPADLKTDEKKKEFFDYVDKNFKAKNEEVELDEAVTVDIEFKKDADGAAAVGSETGRKGLVVSGKKVRDKVYKMTFTNDAMMNKFMDKYESKLNEEVELDEKEHTGKSMSMDKVKSKVKAMSSDDQEYLLKLMKGVKKLPKSQLPEEAMGGAVAPVGAASASATAPTASFIFGGRSKKPSPGSKPGKKSDRGSDVGGAVIDAVVDGLGIPENKRRPTVERFIGDLINGAIPHLGIIRTIENVINFIENLPGGGAGGEG